MNINTILKKCDYYIKFFENVENFNMFTINEFLDFANLHLPRYSNMAFDINKVDSANMSKHAKIIKEFIKTNGSKNIAQNINVVSNYKNNEIITALFGLITFIFSAGFYLGTEKINTDYLINKTELKKIKDSIFIISTKSRSNRKK